MLLKGIEPDLYAGWRRVYIYLYIYMYTWVCIAHSSFKTATNASTKDILHSRWMEWAGVWTEVGWSHRKAISISSSRGGGPQFRCPIAARRLVLLCVSLCLTPPTKQKEEKKGFLLESWDQDEKKGGRGGVERKEGPYRDVNPRRKQLFTQSLPAARSPFSQTPPPPPPPIQCP